MKTCGTDDISGLEVHITADSAPEWARALSADEYDEPDEDGGPLDDAERLPRRGRRRRRGARIR